MNARKSDGFPQVNDPPAPPVEMMYLMPALAQALTFALMKAETWYEPQASDVHDPPAKAHVTVVIPVPASADIDRHVLVVLLVPPQAMLDLAMEHHQTLVREVAFQ
ncbi:unnamed protein product (mitochondrion) [Plasmodiophora brassicae]|uniref:Uncharacterized protein n=1 Tax=Plasmodiophora brassicae TaxID=37360 RepID=A0A3P3Y7L3_PLABS|nr:unnamed protein product [Plasmodiophora brassicae]